MLKVVHDVEASHESAGGSLLDEIVRDGARQMLAAALQAEVAAYIEAFADEVDEAGRRLVVRNGHHERREVITAAGAIPVRAPRVNDKRVDPVTGHSSSQHKAAGAQSTRPTSSRSSVPAPPSKRASWSNETTNAPPPMATNQEGISKLPDTPIHKS
jgi:hypothetical protein